MLIASHGTCLAFNCGIWRNAMGLKRSLDELKASLSIGCLCRLWN